MKTVSGLYSFSMECSEIGIQKMKKKISCQNLNYLPFLLECLD